MDKLKLKGEFYILLAAIIWGSAFVVQKVGMDYVGPLTFTAFRFGIGTLAMFPILAITRMSRRKKDVTRTNEAKMDKADARRIPRDLLIGGIWIGVANFAGSILQQTGLIYTTAGKAGFLTAMYLVIVPIILLILGHKIHLLTWVGIIVATFGMYLLTMSGGWSFQIGDLLCFLGAVGFAFQIVLVDRFVDRTDPLELATFEFGVTAILSIIGAVLFETTTISALLQCTWAILYTAILEVCVAFSLQIVGQQYASPAIATILMSMESVFAVLSGLIFLGEIMSGREVLGCCIMFFAFLVAQIPEMRNGETNN